MVWNESDLMLKELGRVECDCPPTPFSTTLVKPFYVSLSQLDLGSLLLHSIAPLV